MSKQFQQVHRLCEQLRGVLTSSQPLVPESVITELTTFCQTLPINIESVDIFQYILRIYLELLDMKQFTDIVLQHHSAAWTLFNRSLWNLLDSIHRWENLDDMTPAARQQSCYRLLDQLSSSTSISAFLHNELPSRVEVAFCGCILILVAQHLRALNATRTMRLDLDRYQNTLFRRFMTFLDDHFMTNKHSQNTSVVYELLALLTNITEKTHVVPMFIQTDYPQACLRWLSLSYLAVDDYAHLATLLYNIARHDDSTILLRTLDCQQVLSRCHDEIVCNTTTVILDNTTSHGSDLYYYMTLILCYDIDELDLNRMTWFITDCLTPTIKQAFCADNFVYFGYHVGEYWLIAMKLCVDDHFLHCAMRNETFSKLLLLSFCYYTDDTKLDDLSNRLVLTTTTNILWSMTFQQHLKAQLINNSEFVKRLEAIRSSELIDKVVLNDYIPRHVPSFRRALDGIWHNLYPATTGKLPSPTKQTPSLMISYSPADLIFCRQLHDLLTKLPQLSVSVDFHSGKYLWKETAASIEQSQLVLFLISKHFYTSASRRQEFIYTRETLKKPIIPVFIDDTYQAKGWLERGLIGQKNVRFGQEDFLRHGDQLLALIGDYLSLNIPSIASLEKSSDVRQWSDRDVQRWFLNNSIIMELQEFYQFQNGTELFTYAEAIVPFPWTKEYDRIRSRFETKFKQDDLHLSPYEFSKFVTALERLLNHRVSTV